MDHKEGFLKMASLLLEKEVIFAEDVENILGPKVKPADEEDLLAEETAKENEKPAEVKPEEGAEETKTN
jgi:cell division protease FtsH